MADNIYLLAFFPRLRGNETGILRSHCCIWTLETPQRGRFHLVRIFDQPVSILLWETSESIDLWKDKQCQQSNFLQGGILLSVCTNVAATKWYRCQFINHLLLVFSIWLITSAYDASFWYSHRCCIGDRHLHWDFIPFNVLSPFSWSSTLCREIWRLSANESLFIVCLPRPCPRWLTSWGTTSRRVKSSALSCQHWGSSSTSWPLR